MFEDQAVGHDIWMKIERAESEAMLQAWCGGGEPEPAPSGSIRAAALISASSRLRWASALGGRDDDCGRGDWFAHYRREGRGRRDRSDVPGRGAKVFGVAWDRHFGIVSAGEDKTVQINRGRDLLAADEQ